MKIKDSLIMLQVVIALFLLFSFTESYAKRGCCSRHGGVAGCDSASGHQSCRDGSTSPSCLCEGASSSIGYGVKS